jgi:hypothetical protein
MIKAALVDAWPLAALLVLVCAVIAAVVRQVRLERRVTIAALHADERGSVQSLSFVLTVPLFIMLMLLAVQITQLMIGQIVVHYAAFAAARSAAVWVPARIEEPLELANWINQRQYSGTEPLGDVANTSPKLAQIHRAAALACVSIAPSRDLGIGDAGDITTLALVAVFSAYSPTAGTNSRLPVRLANKWAYAFRATDVELSTFHRRYGPGYRDEPPLWDSNPWSVEAYYKATEIGWRDEITVKVTHHFALLPGPGKLLARRANESFRPDTVSPSISRAGSVYYIPITASATLAPEGEKSVAPYVHPIF